MKIKEKILEIEKGIASLQFQSRKEEVVNGLIHGIGTILSIAALILLIVFASKYGNAKHIVSFSIFGLTLIFLYFSSTIFHFSKKPKIKKVFRIFDYSGIFLLIAGTYTPITLVYLDGAWGWSLFGVVWFLALIGIILRVAFPSKVELIIGAIYILMGWVIVFAAKPALETIPFSVLVWLCIGGASYMSGLIFLSWKKLPFHHAIWHLFVLGGSTTHFFGILLSIRH